MKLYKNGISLSRKCPLKLNRYNGERKTEGSLF